MPWGVTATPSLCLATALGVWLMCAPTVFGIDIAQPAAHSDHLVGALVVVVAVVCLAEVARPARFLNVLLGAWLVLAPWLLSGGTPLYWSLSALTGVVVALLGLPLGRLRDHYGTFDDVVIWSPRADSRERHRRQPWALESSARAQRPLTSRRA
jgi:hypothetical protein